MRPLPGLVSLVSVSARNWCYLCGRIERVETGEIVEIAKVHAVFMQVVEKVLGWRLGRGEYPTVRSLDDTAPASIVSGVRRMVVP